MAAMTFALVLIFLAIWMTYAGSHTYPRYEQLPPGRATTVQGITYKLIKLTRTAVIIDGDQSKPAQAGAIYVVAELEVTAGKKDPTCSIELVGDGKRTWESDSSFYDRKLPQYCGSYDHPVTPGKPFQLEQIFQIPARFADRLYGVGVPDSSSPAPTRVLTP
ncbi:MAG: hypothetical protein J2P23_14910 [Microlunatus sp.]|nr:hypothetical protein [Microlunatus sp.]